LIKRRTEKKKKKKKKKKKGKEKIEVKEGVPELEGRISDDLDGGGFLNHPSEMAPSNLAEPSSLVGIASEINSSFLSAKTLVGNDDATLLDIDFNNTFDFIFDSKKMD
jgi:hypothetical protein